MNENLIQDAGYLGGIAQTERITELSDDQKKALSFVDDFMNSNRKQAIIGGCAGCGKSSIIPFIIKKYSREDEDLAVIMPCRSIEVCTYTGKASIVLKRKGILRARTLHSFLYHARKDVDKDGNVIIVYEKLPPSFFTGVKLLIIDEASMVSKEMYDYISTLPFKTLYIGDHFQLPPIGDNFNIMQNPDFKMEKILRQNENNPIIQLAEMARRGEKIPLGIYGTSKCTMNLDYSKLIDFDQVLTWTNKTKDTVNELIRKQKGFDELKPSVDDKMVVKVNSRRFNLFNGQIVYIMDEPKKNKYGGWKVSLADELAYRDPFIMAQTDEYIKATASIHLSKEEIDRLRVMSFKNKDISKLNPYQIHLDWGYALTVHSAQGSSWENVALIFEKKMYHISNDAYRWLYTGITRAEQSITIFMI